jgi:hypothetical protein
MQHLCSASCVHGEALERKGKAHWWLCMQQKRPTWSLPTTVCVREWGHNNRTSFCCSLACAVKFSFAALAFSPVLLSVLRSEKSKDKKTVLAGIELGMWLMAGIISQTVGMKSGSNSISLLFTFTIVLVPLLEVSTGRRSISQFTWLASLAALTGAHPFH